MERALNRSRHLVASNTGYVGYSREQVERVVSGSRSSATRERLHLGGLWTPDVATVVFALGAERHLRRRDAVASLAALLGALVVLGAHLLTPFLLVALLPLALLALMGWYTLSYDLEHASLDDLVDEVLPRFVTTLPAARASEARVRPAVLAALSLDEDGWEVFWSLAGEFSGTVGDLAELSVRV